ncbi:MAG: DUF1934 domain-containing protein [Lachnospiraceae bacterium]|nr:DUF1934 domain-containing protein [Lachnospiraceae bacterium]
MPTQEVSIIVRGSQLDEEGRETITELNIQGQYFVQNGSRYLLYEEPDPETGGSTRTTLKIKDRVTELTRRGAVCSRMLFEVGKTCRTDYVTPYGSFPLEVCTEDIRSLWSDDGGTLQLTYRLLAENRLLSRNRLSLIIRNFSEKV